MDRANEILSDPNLAYIDGELRLLRLKMEALFRSNPVPAAGIDGVPAEDADETGQEEKRIEEFLATLRQEAKVQKWVLQLPRIAEAFSLNQFEHQLLVLAAAPDLDAGFGQWIGRAQGNGASWPSVGLAWRLFCPSTEACVQSRNSLREDAPLLRFRLVDSPEGDVPLPDRVLRADRRIVDALAGGVMVDARITPLLRIWPPVAPGAGVDCGDPRLVERLRSCIQRSLGANAPTPSHVMIHLHGAPLPDLEALAAQVTASLRLPMLSASISAMPMGLARIFVRESLLQPAALFVQAAPGEPQLTQWANILADGSPITFLASEQALPPLAACERLGWLPVAVPRLSVRQRLKLWDCALSAIGISGNGSSAALVNNFAMSAGDIQQAARTAGRLAWFRDEEPQIEDVLRACRMDSHHRMSDLAQRLNPLYEWDDLLLPDNSKSKLRELCDQVRSQNTVLDEYGFTHCLSRGQGVTGLFAGPSGTGKTMAAEVVARDLKRELYRVDLARVVSKYIGETEKNLRQVFEEAERARCVVLFDEADALFGRRSEVRDSHDRYANIEVSYLLQWLEETRFSVVLLASNRRESIDEAFLRRFRFVVEFPLPNAELRRKLWEKSFPPQTPVQGVRFDKIADRLPLSGANIRNIALAAAHLAAADGGVVGPSQIAHGMRRELEKLGRPMPVQEADLRHEPTTRGGTTG